MITAIFMLSTICQQAAQDDSNIVLQKIEQTAYKAAKTYVPERLKSPGSAKFPEDTIKSEHVADEVGKPVGRYIVTGRVDAQNSFGGLLAATWATSVVYEPKTNKIHLVWVSLMDADGDITICHTFDVNLHYLHPKPSCTEGSVSMTKISSLTQNKVALFYDEQSIRKFLDSKEGLTRNRLLKTLGKKRKVVPCESRKLFEIQHVYDDYLKIKMIDDEGKASALEVFMLKDSFDEHP